MWASLEKFKGVVGPPIEKNEEDPRISQASYFID